MAEPIIIIKGQSPLPGPKERKQKQTIEIKFNDGRTGSKDDFESDRPLTGSVWEGREKDGIVEIRRTD